MPFNPMQLMTMIRQGGNPQQMVMQMLQGQMQSNPMMANLFDLAKQGNGAEIETIARNVCKEKGLDFDKEFANFKQQLGL